MQMKPRVVLLLSLLSIALPAEERVYITDQYFSEKPGSAKLSTIEKGRWYYLNTDLSDTALWDSIGFIHVWIHTAENFSGNHQNKGGMLDPASNYILNMDFDTTMLFARDTVTRKSIMVMGKQYAYIDDRQNLYYWNFQQRRLIVRFRLLAQAETGPWIISSYVNYSDDFESEPVHRLINVTARRSYGFLMVLPLLLLVLILRRKRTVPLSEQEKICLKGIRYINENYANIKNTAEIARAAGLSHGYFRKIFKSCRKIGLKDFLIQVRIRKSRELLEKGHSNITEIMQQVGFSNPSHFAATFKKVTGKTPSQVQNRQ